MALREINLVSDDFLFQRKLSYHLSLWICLLIISLSSITGFHLYQTRAAHANRPPCASMEELGERLGLKIEEINRLQDELGLLDQQESGLKTAIWKPVYSRVLLSLVEVMNNNTWITQLAVETDKEVKNRSNMNLKGFSKNGAELGDLIENLSGRVLFQDVSLIYARQAGMNDSEQHADESLNLIEFHIQCKVTG
jgi:Tfp pilus assembly protein PilN